MRLLIAHDGSSSADAALADLARAGLAEAAQALVLSVADVWLPPDDVFAGPSITEAVLRQVREDAGAVFRQAQDTARAATRKLHQLLPSWRVHSLATAGPPAIEILRRSNQVRADLLIVGPHGRSGPLPAMLGGVTFKVLTHAQRTVRVCRPVPEPRDPGEPLRLIIGIDGSPHCQAALRAVCSRSWPADTSVRVVTAIEPGVTGAALHEALSRGKGLSDWSLSVAREAVHVLRGHGLDAREIVERGDPRELLLHAAEESCADAIFVGARGLTRTQQLLLGNVPIHIAMRARCTVEVAHLPARTQAVDARPLGARAEGIFV